jgi:hypothetical protein
MKGFPLKIDERDIKRNMSSPAISSKAKVRVIIVLGCHVTFYKESTDFRLG